MLNVRIREQRIANKVTQQKMADQLNLTLNAYQKYEQAERYPSLDTLVKISDFFGVSTDYLLCRDNFIEKTKGDETMDYSEYDEYKEVSSIEEVNQLKKAGWDVISIVPVSNGEDSHFLYCMGYIKSSFNGCGWR